MWLASVSARRADGSIIPTEQWTRGKGRLLAAERLIDAAMSGVGDCSRERQFLMPITLCRHRALGADEMRKLPKWWHDAPALDAAGPALRVLWSRGIDEILSLQPCANPGRDYRSKDVWMLVECGRCPSCIARQEAAAERSADA